MGKMTGGSSRGLSPNNLDPTPRLGLYFRGSSNTFSVKPLLSQTGVERMHSICIIHKSA